MKIVILADTHLNKETDMLKTLLDKLGEVDLIIHAGDYINDAVVDTLRKIPGFHGVWGNCDTAGIQNTLKEKELLTLDSYRLGIFHGHGKGKSTLDRAYAAFENDNVNIIVFGHSHQPSITTKNKVLMLNPGSPTSKRTQKWYTFILLNLSAASIEAKLVLFDNIQALSLNP